MYTFDQLKKDVLQEANNLKQYATAEEKNRLDIFELNPTNMKNCVYGLMTGHCDSERALELIQKCTVRYMADGNLTLINLDGFKRIERNVNGETVNDLRSKRISSWSDETSHFSMIEAYILLPGANNEGLIAYIKGEVDTVEL